MDNTQIPAQGALVEGASLTLVGQSPRVEALRSAIADTIGPIDGHGDGAMPTIGGAAGSMQATCSLREVRQVAEREAITQALRESHGQVPAAAAALGISRAQLYRLIGSLRVNHRPFEVDQAGKSIPPG